MKNVNQYKNRFYTLLESELGNVKPLLSEQMELNSKENIIKFQTWVKQHYPSFDLGKSGPQGNGIDGQKGGKTNIAWSKYGKEYLSSQSSNDNSMAETGKDIVDATKQTLSRMLDSGDFDYNFIETRISEKEAANLLKEILTKEDEEFFYNLPEAVIEAIFIRLKNAGCDFFLNFLLTINPDCVQDNSTKSLQNIPENILVVWSNKRERYRLLGNRLRKYFETLLPMDINKKYHKESIASIINFISTNCIEMEG